MGTQTTLPCTQAEDSGLLSPLQSPNWVKVCLVSTVFFLPVSIVLRVEKCLGLSVRDRVLCLRSLTADLAKPNYNLTSKPSSLGSLGRRFSSKPNCKMLPMAQKEEGSMTQQPAASNTPQSGCRRDFLNVHHRLQYRLNSHAQQHESLFFSHRFVLRSRLSGIP